MQSCQIQGCLVECHTVGRGDHGRASDCRSMGSWSSVRPSVEGTMVRINLPPFRSNFVQPTWPVSFGRDTEIHSSFLSDVYASRKSKRSHIGAKCVTCCGLHLSRATAEASTTRLSQVCLRPRKRTRLNECTASAHPREY